MARNSLGPVTVVLRFPWGGDFIENKVESHDVVVRKDGEKLAGNTEKAVGAVGVGLDIIKESTMMVMEAPHDDCDHLADIPPEISLNSSSESMKRKFEDVLVLQEFQEAAKNRSRLKKNMEDEHHGLQWRRQRRRETDIQI